MNRKFDWPTVAVWLLCVPALCVGTYVALAYLAIGLAQGVAR